MIRKLFLLSILIGSAGLLNAQYVMKQDSSILLNNMYIQIEVNESVNAIYNAEHDKVEKDFEWLKYRFPNHPLPYFLYGLNEWWKILPEPSAYEGGEKLIAYLDTAQYYAEKMEEADEDNLEATFFLAAIHGFKGRFYADNQSWTKAAFSARNALNYMEESKGNRNLSPEFLFGDALYNYYVEWVPENYPILKPVLRFFDDGDKKLGVEQLTKVAQNAFYTRTEAQYFLMRILALDEGELQKGLQLSEYLHETYPQNAYFHRFYARLLYTAGKIQDSERECLEIFQRLDSGAIGYGGTSGRYAGFFLGQIYERKGNIDEAKKYYERAMISSESINEEDAGYYLYSIYHLGLIAEKQGDTELAEFYYKKTKKKADRSQGVFKSARNKLREL
ncbi:tetratricopeptide repeat protein [Marivirga arenosa]|uniref:Tetratricopeptide repeat protein n=1 Tax=Marivirga arenosa TaxID=3059076 RepID=A0AA51N8X5_9BACT|nr:MULTISPECIES: tetratricopeptide repeat protein [unclassified Marivirga]WKK83016.2 tetratricopeptide repeat protein [Marivirga sp. BKB1-2]WMN07915.1 tetratricopeptide repeat protein [Marivirga sp. ABR2-2]